MQSTDTATSNEFDTVTRAGILPSQALEAAIAEGRLAADPPIEDAQIQPASLDLRLGPVAHRVRASFLPGKGRTVAQKLDSLAMHTIDLSAGAVLERGCVYIVPLMERLRLPAEIDGRANPKSSIGRLDVFTRLIVDEAVEFDRVGPGYSGPLYAEIAPRTFSILVRPGSRLNQLRLRRGRPSLDDESLRRLQREVGLVHAEPGTERIADGIAVSIDLHGDPDSDGCVGYRARKHTGVVDIERVGAYDADEFWERLTPRASEGLILSPDEFHILVSREAVTVPPDHAAEMVPFDAEVGEFRVHYAGFFDPGFGAAEADGTGSRAVLEIRSHDVPFVVEHGQIVARLVYEPLLERPLRIYGQSIGSNYQRQGLALAKQFRR